MYLKFVLITCAGFFLLGCGEGKLAIGPEQYNAKIAIEGFLIPHKKVSRIFVWRNFPVNQNVGNPTLPDAKVFITDLESGDAYRLSYHADSAYFQYPGNDLFIEYGKSYRLDVTAIINGQELQASATTTVPPAGLEVTGVNFSQLKYRQRNENDEVLNFKVDFERSPGIDFYMATILAVDADVSNFIYDNSFTDATEEDVRNDFNDYRFNHEWIQNTPLTPGQSSLEIFWFDLWFYSRYEVIIFAADRNYRDYIRTYNDVQEEDGNYHEPVFHIDGDGIGVFGSAVVDTLYFEVLR